jgi:hypothetical protein
LAAPTLTSQNYPFKIGVVLLQFPRTHAPQIIVWKRLFAFCRTASSTLWSLTKSVEASQLLLGHTTPNVTTKYYLKANEQALTDGLKQLEDSLRT